MNLPAWIVKLFRGDRILVLIILLAASIRVLGLGDAPFSDEVVWKPPIEGMLNGIFYSTKLVPHPPMIILSFSAVALAWGLSIQAFRMVPFLTGLASIIVVYYFAKSLYGRRAAILAALLMAIVFYPVWMSLFMDSDGSILTLFLLTALFSFHKLEKTGGRKWMAMTGLFFGLALLSKYTAIVFVPILLLYGLMSSRLRNWKTMILPLAIGFAIFAIFPLMSLLFNSPDTFLDTLRYGAQNIGRLDANNIFQSYALSFARLVIFLFQYGTPILCIVPLYSLKKSGKQEYLLFSFLVVFLVLYALVIPGGPKARYMMPMVPVLAILASKNLAGFSGKFSRKDLKEFIIFFAVSLAVLILLNMYGTSESFNSQKIDPGLLLRNSMFWYSGLASTPFTIHVHSLIFVIAASVTLFALSLRFGMRFFTALIALGLAFNCFIVFQSFYPTVGPDYSATIFEMMEYYKASNLSCSSLYSTEKSFMFYMDGVKNYYDIVAQKDLKGCVFTVNVQDFTDIGNMENLLKDCTKVKSFYSNNFELGDIYVC